MGIDDKQEIVRLTEQRDALLQVCRWAAILLDQLIEAEPWCGTSWNMTRVRQALSDAIAQAEATQPVLL